MIFVGPISFLKKLSALKFTSTAGLISICYIAGMVVYFFFNQDDITVTSSASPIEIRPVYISVETLSVFPIFVLAYVNHMNIFPIYSEFGKENPTKKTYQVIFIAMPFCMICFLVVATFGYLTWGFDTSANVINNYPTNNVAVVVARVCTTLIILASYPIVLNPARLNFDSALFSSRGPLFHPIARHCGETVCTHAQSN
ncbi:Vacuolar amino acid transporter 6 [Pelomyxa schiedti]|nr:Vacuolar amino acid transporter 6 [Pelomyxa schiedti]